ncbi:hypothetical protein LTR22_027017 [Elasticomyces elasticus]|nr:hypothetical protein LTR22_027017 [Elasticomyces elasticus]
MAATTTPEIFNQVFAAGADDSFWKLHKIPDSLPEEEHLTPSQLNVAIEDKWDYLCDFDEVGGWVMPPARPGPSPVPAINTPEPDHDSAEQTTMCMYLIEQVGTSVFGAQDIHGNTALHY